MRIRSSLLLAAFADEEARSTSASRTSPSGVSSNTQAMTAVGTSPIARTITTARMAASVRPNTGNSVSTTWISSQLTAMYAADTRRTLRRFSSVKMGMA